MSAPGVPGPGDPFVRVRAGEFVLGGEPFVPRGVGSYPLLDHVARGRSDAVRDILDQALALRRPLIRTHAFFEGGESPGRLRSADGTLHEPGLRALDRVLAMAAERGVALLLPVANNWPDYGGAAAVVQMVAPDRRDLFGRVDKDAFFDDPRCVRAQAAFVRALVSRVNHLSGVRYGDDPTIFAWELCNEARLVRHTRRRDPGRTLGNWATAMRAAFDHAGARQLVGWGGSGHRGERGEDMGAVLATRAVDFATLHLYPFHGDPSLARITPWPARACAAVRAGVAQLRDRAELARSQGVPLLVEELGWKTGAHTEQAERAQVMRGWLREARALGVGTLPWMIGERGRPDYDGLLLRPQHAELFALLAAT